MVPPVVSLVKRAQRSPSYGCYLVECTALRYGQLCVCACDWDLERWQGCRICQSQDMRRMSVQLLYSNTITVQRRHIVIVPRRGTRTHRRSKPMPRHGPPNSRHDSGKQYDPDHDQRCAATQDLLDGSFAHFDRLERVGL
jgi:hypothetical protein